MNNENKELLKEVMKKTAEITVNSCIAVFNFLNPPPPPAIDQFNLLDWDEFGRVDMAAMNRRVIPVLSEYLESVKPIFARFWQGLYYVDYEYYSIKDERLKNEENVGLLLSQLLTSSLVSYYSQKANLDCNFYIVCDAQSGRDINKLRVYYYCYFNSEKVLHEIRKQLFI